MAFVLPREPSTQESLQCLACAAEQELNDFHGDDLVQLMRGTHDKQAQIESYTGIDWNVMRRRFEDWSTDSDVRVLGLWIQSSVTIARSLAKSKYLEGKYKFYRQDQFPETGAASGNGFKSNFDIIKNRIKAAIKKDPKFGKGVAGKVLGKLTLNSDKWNPADIVAVQTAHKNKWTKEINSFASNNRPNRGVAMKNDLIDYVQKLEKQDPKNFKKLEIVPAMGDLYDYNKLIFEGIDSNQFVPISLKQSEVDNPDSKLISMREPKDLEKYFNMTVDLGKVQYKPTTQKALIPFTISGLPGKNGNYSFDVRGFESTRKIEDIQMGLLKEGSATYHGKITLPVATYITKLSGGRTALSSLNAKKRSLLRELPNNLKSKMKSNKHGFTDYKVFLDHYSKSQVNINADVDSWAEYVDFLSGGATTKKDFKKEAKGDRFHSDKAKEYDLKKSFPRAKYMKNKVQAYEMAYVIDKSPLNRTIKDNILKSMWMYAASEGFTVFNTDRTTAFLLAGSYVKCAA